MGESKKYFKDFSAEESIEIGTAFNDYIRVTQERNSKIKTLIYRRVPKDIYSFYECVGLRLEGKVIKTSNVSDVLKIGKKILVTGTGGIGKWCCTIKVDIENSKSQYIEKDKQEETKDGSESTKI